ncbi:MAG: hypothetical protein KIT84_06420 [Labilithrix sp.]|nr:hypothetical protein [Labilithrix sp.]MCW5810627.1 hypothetical protein [Labilithrix sp.]
MKRFAILSGLVGVALASAAHAAPADSKAPSLSPTARAPVVSALQTSVAVQPTDVGCGKPLVARVTVTNNSLTNAWNGKVELVYGGQTDATTVNVPAKAGAKGFTVTGKALNCKAALGTAKVNVYGESNNLLQSKTLSPKSYKGEGTWSPPSSTSTDVFVRGGFFGGTCGATPSYGHVHLALFGGAPKEATIAINWASFALAPTKQMVQPNGPYTQVKLPIAGSGVIDCQAASGIPSMSFTLNGAGNTVNATEVTFAP